MPPGPASQAQTITSPRLSVSPSLNAISKTTTSECNNSKRNRANRLGNSIRRAGHSLNPRNIVSERNQQSARLKQAIHSLDPNSNSINKPISSPIIQRAVPMTPISLECKPFDNDDCTTARPNDPFITQSFISSEIIPTPAPSFSRISFQNQLTYSDQTKSTTDTMSASFQSPISPIEPRTFSPFSPRPQFDESSDPLNSSSLQSSSPICIPLTPTLNQKNLSNTTPSPYRPNQDDNSQTNSPDHSRCPSQSILTIALTKAQTAVHLDTALKIPEAIHAYTEAVLLLEEVIDKIDVMSKEREQKEHECLMRDQARDRIWAEEICKRLGRDDVNDFDREELESRLREKERKWREKQRKMEKRKQARADEEDRLIGIHNTYASRIAELQAEVLSPRLSFINPDQDPADTSMTSSNDRKGSIDQSALRSKTPSQHHEQLAHHTLAEAERTSISSDSTTRGGTTELHESTAMLQPATREQVSLTHHHSQSFKKSHEIAEEEKDVVSERLPVPIHYGSSHLQNTRNRSSSSFSGTSLSQIGRPQSIESITTTRTSISSTAYKAEQSLSTVVYKPNETQFEPFDGGKRSSIGNLLVSHNRPASHHSPRLFSTSISLRPESPSTAVPTNPANQNVKRRSSQKLLVSDTTTRGTISQRRRSPTCLDAQGRLLPISDDYEQSDALSHLPPSSSSSPEAYLAPGNQASASMGRRPSNVSLMYTAPSPAIPLRLRSYSQPGKRPSLLSFIADKTPPVPSSPIRTELLQQSSRSISRKSPSPLANSSSLDPLASRSASFISCSSPLAYASMTPGNFTEVPTRSDNHRCSPSVAVYGIQPYAHATPSVGSNQLGGLAPVGVLPTYPKSASRRPFHLMRQISTSISSGAYVSPRLYVPRQMWHQVQVKLHGLETKIKLMDTLLAGLELVERDGALLVGGVEGSNKSGANWDMGGDVGRHPSSTTLSSQVLNVTERFMRRLEIFEELLDNLQTGGAKKLGLHNNGPHETVYGQDAMRKSGGFGTLMAHKLGKGLDRISLRSNTDLPTSYIETIARLFEKSQVIDGHLAALEHASRSHNKGGRRVGLYHSIGQQSKQHIEGRLRRVSEFYSTVVCKFVVADMGVLLDKYVKRGGNWCGD